MTTKDSGELRRRLEEALRRVEELRRKSEEKRAYRVNEFCAAYGLSRTTTYALIGAGNFAPLWSLADA